MADTKSINWSTTAYGTAPDSSTLDLGVAENFTFEAWVYPTSLPSNNTRWNSHPIFTKWQPSQTREYYWGLSKDAGGALYLDVITTDNNTTDAGHCAITGKAMNTYSANTWIYVAITYDDSTGTFTYYQGDEDTSPASLGTTVDGYGANVGTSRLMVAGGDNITTTTFPGLFGEIRIWRAKRTITELQDNYAPSAISSGTGLIALWDFNDTATDIVNSNVLTYTNSPTYSTNIPVVGGATGPANLKSLNTNLKANIKSYNTNLIANVKSINTNV